MRDMLSMQELQSLTKYGEVNETFMEARTRWSTCLVQLLQACNHLSNGLKLWVIEPPEEWEDNEFQVVLRRIREDVKDAHAVVACI